MFPSPIVTRDRFLRMQVRAWAHTATAHLTPSVSRQAHAPSNAIPSFFSLTSHPSSLSLLILHHPPASAVGRVAGRHGAHQAAARPGHRGHVHGDAGLLVPAPVSDGRPSPGWAPLSSFFTAHFLLTRLLSPSFFPCLCARLQLPAGHGRALRISLARGSSLLASVCLIDQTRLHDRTLIYMRHGAELELSLPPRVIA